MKKSVQMQQQTTIPVGIIIISVLNFLGTAVGLLFGVFMLILGASAASNPEAFAEGIREAISQGGTLPAEFSDPAVFVEFFGTMAIVAGIIFILLGILGLVIGIGLLKRKKWARILTIICAAVGLVLALLSLFSGAIFAFLFYGIIYGVIFWYMLWNKDACAYFGAKPLGKK